MSRYARQVLDRLLAGRPRLGDTRLACVDGPAGAGKSTLAGELADAARAAGPDVHVLHMDDLYEGWTGLAGLARRLAEEVVGPLAEGRPGRYRRWDWSTSAWAETHEVPPTDLLLLEGVGSGTPLLAPWRSLLVWVDAPPGLRRHRALARDGDAFAPYWEAWARDEAAVLARDRTRDHADVVVDGSGGAVVDQRAQLAHGGPRPGPVGALDAEGRDGGAVGEVERGPRGAGR